MLVTVNLAINIKVILKLIVEPELFLGEYTVFNNSFMDLNCPELHSCLESVTLSNHSSEMIYNFLIKTCHKTHKEFVSEVIKV